MLILTVIHLQPIMEIVLNRQGSTSYHRHVSSKHGTSCQCMFMMQGTKTLHHACVFNHPLCRLGESLGFKPGGKLRYMALGQGMGPKAQELLEAGAARGLWVMLQVLGTGWLA